MWRVEKTAIKGSEGKQKALAGIAEKTVCPSAAAHKIWWGAHSSDGPVTSAKDSGQGVGTFTLRRPGPIFLDPLPLARTAAL